MSILLETRELVVRRGNRVVVEDVAFTLRRGEAVALVGPNGAGKSTLVRALAGLLPPAAGSVRLAGRPLAEWSRDALARMVALVTSEEEGAGGLCVADRVRLGRYPHRGPFRPLLAHDIAAVEAALERTGITHLRDRDLLTLSAGERALSALARGLAQEPQVLLLDEPAAHLDIGHQLALFRVLDEVRSAGTAVLAVVHDLQRAAAWAERMVLLAGGRVMADGAPPDVLASPAAATAFGVAIRQHGVPGVPQPLYSFLPR